jgi:cytochrome c oxidase subunit 3
MTQAAHITDAHGHDEHGHGHTPNLAHHFDTMEQQVDSGKLGMWVFLATEILMFGGLFCAYAVWRGNHYESFEIGHKYLDTFWGAFNTVVLIASSFTMAWAVRTAQLNKRTATSILLALTFLGGVGFMCVKYVEYSHKFHLGLGPGSFYNPHPFLNADSHAAAPAGAPASAPAPNATALPAPGSAPQGLTSYALVGEQPPAHPGHGPAAPSHADEHGIHNTPEQMATARTFFSIYFCMTGLHGLHVIVGMLLIAWVWLRNIRGEFDSTYNAPVDLVGLYWHLVDLIWIFLFPLLYLIS